MKNQMDTRNRSGFDVVADLRKLDRKRLLAVLGSHSIPANEVAKSLREQWSQVVGMVGFEPVRLITGCAPAGAEKAARLIAKSVTGKLAVVFHRADLVYGPKHAESMRDMLVVQEASVLLLLVTKPGQGLKNMRYLFPANGKKIHEIEVG